VSIAKYI